MKVVLSLLVSLMLASALFAQAPERRAPEGEAVLSQASEGVRPFDEAGRFFFQTYGPADYDAHPQNWAFTQDERGILYVGNTAGVLTFDGVRWSAPVAPPNRSIVRSLARGPGGRVYVGAENELGTLVPDSTGSLRYVSLLDELPDEAHDFGPVWRTEATSRGVFFLTSAYLFRWRNGDMTVWNRPFVGPSGYAVRDTFHVVDQDEGLLQVRGDALHAVPGGDFFAGERVYAVLPYGRQDLLVATDTALFRYDGQRAMPFRTDADTLLSQSWIYHGTVLPGGLTVLATIRDGALVLGPQGQVLRRLTERDGLRTNTVLHAFADRDGGLWLGLDGGITRLELPAPLTFFDEATGFEGGPNDVIRHDGTLFLTTNHGVFFLDATAQRSRFRPVPGLAAQCWSFVSTEAGLLVGASSGIHRVRRDGVTPLGGGPQVYVLYRSRHDPTRLYAGEQHGLATLRRTDGRWSYEGLVDGITETVRSIAEDDAGHLWLGTNYEGLLRVTLRADSVAAVERFDEADGLPAGRNQPFFADGRLLVATEEGLYRLTGTDVPSFERDPVLGGVLDDSTAAVNDPYVDARGHLWLRVGDALGVVHRQADGEGVWDAAPFARLDDATSRGFYREPDGTLWVARTDDVVRYVPAPQPRRPDVTALVRRVTTQDGDALLFGGYGAPAATPSLPYANNALHVVYAAPHFDAPAATRYRVRLDGFDESWSPWRTDVDKEYTHLPPGDYTFRVQARDTYGRISQEGRFAFTILTPWYWQSWAYVLYFFGGVALIVGLSFWASRRRLRRLQAQKDHLEHLVAERTHKVEQQKDALQKLNDELGRTNEELLRANDQKTELLGMTAHDLRNPLSSIKGASQILLEELGSDLPQYELVDIIHENADRMTSLINELLESVALESGRIQLEKERLDLSESTRRVVRNHRLQAERKGQSLHLDVAPGDDLHVEADATRLREVISNLVSNAIKYSPLDQPIYVSVARQNGTVRLAVRDEGPGLSEHDQQLLFQPFQRLSPRPTAGEPSSGLGLSIVKQIVELHGGRIWVESERGVGSTFIIALPSADAPAAPPEAAPKATHRS